MKRKSGCGLGMLAIALVFEGRVFVCGGSGRVQHFTLWGSPDDTKAASHFHPSLSPEFNSLCNSARGADSRG